MTQNGDLQLFQQRLAQTARDIDALLDQMLDARAAAAPRVVEAMRHAALGQGKRLRPFFVRESARLLGADDAQALRVGAALECVHCYSLVHDDLPAMDDDDLRRGKPTCHVAFDEATAILAGDALLTKAFAILADAATHPHAQVRAELIAALAQAAGHEGMVGGQMLDIEAEARRDLDENDILRIQKLKTGALIRYALTAGAILARAPARDRTRLANYADAVGLAFQIADDILDVEASAEELGKTPGKDAAANKATFVKLYGLKRAKLKARELVKVAMHALEPYGEKAQLLMQAARFVIERRK